MLGVKVQDYMDEEGLPSSWKKRKGCILPMWQKEAMWMDFSADAPCLVIQPVESVILDYLLCFYCDISGAVKIGVGKINAITGKPWQSRTLSTTKDTQNYCPLPRQPYVPMFLLVSDRI